MDDLTAKFLPQFVELARSRLAQARQVAVDREPPATTQAIVALHTLAGEAGLLGLSDVVPLARDCEARVKALQASRADDDSDRLVAALGELERVIERIAAAHPARPRGA